MRLRSAVAGAFLLSAIFNDPSNAQVGCLITVNWVLPPVGFGVQDTGLNGSGYYPFDLATSSNANWGIVAYSNAANEAYLNAFSTSTSGSTTTYSTTQSSTAAQGMTVSLAFNSANNLTTQTIGQSGVTTGTGCTSASAPLEFDLFLSANSHTPPNGDPTYPSAYVSGAPSPTLDKITGIMISGTVTTQSTSSSTGSTASPCAVNQSAMLYALILNNTTSSQTLFYQLAFNYFCYNGSNSAFNAFCAATVPSMNYFFTGSGGLWGIDDPITNYSNSITNAPYSLLSSSTSADIEINFLPRLQYLISNGQYSLDTNLSHWKVGSFYYGQHTWGSAQMISSWSSTNLSPTIVYPGPR